MKLRVRYAKLGKVRFLAHRDVARVWERAIRRTGLPIAYSEGFSPRPRLHFGLALSVGHESVDEYIDIDLREPVDVTAAGEGLAASLPSGIELLDLAVIERGTTSLQEAVDLVVWRFVVPPGESDGLEARVEQLLAATTVPIEVERKGKPQTIDLRPQLAGLTLEAASGDDPDLPEGAAVLVAELRTRPRSVRPGELLAALGLEGPDVRIRRLHQFIESDGARRSPLTADDAPRPAAERLAG